MSALLDEQYFTWLYSQVGSVRLRNRNRTHWSLLRQLYNKEFVWIIPNDDNRVEDGRDLRIEFLEQAGYDRTDTAWLDLSCSMLEMLIGLSRRLAFEDDGEPRNWFWHLIEVIDLEQFNDNHYDENAEDIIDECLERIIWRRYLPNGKGGLFPLRNPDEDQREVELWYQAAAYLLEVLWP